MVSPPINHTGVCGIYCYVIQLGMAFSSDEEGGAAEEDLLAVLKVRPFFRFSCRTTSLIVHGRLCLIEHSTIFTRRAFSGRPLRF